MTRLTERPLKLAAFVTMTQFCALAVIVCLIVWKATDADYFWPKWVILGVVINVAVSARCLYGRRR